MQADDGVNPPTLADLYAALTEVFADAGSVIWLLSVNPMLGHARPCDVWPAEPERVLAALDMLASGAYA